MEVIWKTNKKAKQNKTKGQWEAQWNYQKSSKLSQSLANTSPWKTLGNSICNLGECKIQMWEYNIWILPHRDFSITLLAASSCYLFGVSVWSGENCSLLNLHLPFCLRTKFCYYGNLIPLHCSLRLCPSLCMFSLLYNHDLEGQTRQPPSQTTAVPSHFHFPDGFLVIRFAKTAKGLILNGNSCWHQHYIE